MGGTAAALSDHQQPHRKSPHPSFSICSLLALLLNHGPCPAVCASNFIVFPPYLLPRYREPFQRLSTLFIIPSPYPHLLPISSCPSHLHTFTPLPSVSSPLSLTSTSLRPPLSSHLPLLLPTLGSTCSIWIERHHTQQKGFHLLWISQGSQHKIQTPLAVHFHINLEILCCFPFILVLIGSLHFVANDVPNNATDTSTITTAIPSLLFARGPIGTTPCQPA